MRPASLAPLLLLLLSSIPALAQDSSALINEALDKKVELKLDSPLPKALQAIEDKTGVPIRPDRSVYELLPWGEQTNIRATIANQTLRQALAAITRKLGLTFRLGAQVVELEPVPALKRLGRRATVQELQILDQLASTPMGLPSERVSVRQLGEAVDKKLVEIKSPFAVELRLSDPTNPGVPLVKETDTITVPRNASMADALESLSKETQGTWYPWGDSIMIVPKVVQVRTQLDKVITRRFDRVDLSQVLQELSEAAGVPFQFEQGALQRVPEQYSKIDLMLNPATIRQALENIKGVTGLDYVVTAQGVYIQNPSPGRGGQGQTDPVVGTVQLENGMQVFVREKDVPPDIREYIRHKIGREIGRMREMMKIEGFAPGQPPATQPTTQPAQAEKPAKDL